MPRRRLIPDPLNGLEHKPQVVAWGLYDLANQSFTLIINTLLFSVFFKDVVVGTADPGRGDRLWSAAVGASMLVVVLISPFVGALADARGWRLKFLVCTGVVAGCLTVALGFVPAGALAIALLLYIPANITYQLGENFLASFLPTVSTRRTMGRVSALGWTLGYVGALVLIIIALASALWLGRQSPETWRPLFILAGLWFLAFIVPAAITLPEPPRAAGAGPGVSNAVRGVLRTIRDAGTRPQLTRFLIAFFVYGLGMQTVIFFATIIAKEEVFTDPDTLLTKLTTFIGVLTVLAGIAAYSTSKVQDRFGAKAVIAFYLVVWVLSTGSVALARSFGPISEPLFWVLSAGFGIGIGGTGTASRAMVGRFTPAHRVAEFFGLWGMVYKLAAVVGVVSFGYVKAGLGAPVALWLLTGFFFVGLLLLWPVNEIAGVRAARREERHPVPA